MMERNYGNEIDELKEQMENLQNRVSSQLEELKDMMLKRIPDKSSVGAILAKKLNHPDSRLNEKMEELCNKTEERGGSGLVSYLGVHSSGGRRSIWVRDTVPTEDLLSLIESGMAGKVLNCIGNQNRLAILLEILRGPKTVAALVEKCNFGSTGQVYHHMKPLLAADIIVEDEQQKGVYVVQPHKVQGVIMLLAGISDMVDETYTRGTWEAAETGEEIG